MAMAIRPRPVVSAPPTCLTPVPTVPPPVPVVIGAGVGVTFARPRTTGVGAPAPTVAGSGFTTVAGPAVNAAPCATLCCGWASMARGRSSRPLMPEHHHQGLMIRLGEIHRPSRLGQPHLYPVRVQQGDHR